MKLRYNKSSYEKARAVFKQSKYLLLNQGEFKQWPPTFSTTIAPYQWKPGLTKTIILNSVLIPLNVQ